MVDPTCEKTAPLPGEGSTSNGQTDKRTILVRKSHCNHTTYGSLVPCDNCYTELPSFNDYTDLCRDSHYIRLPSSWTVLVADIRGSTAYIEQGRYRDVNTVGAMCICAVHNALFTAELPYVFGGDGTSMVVRPDQLDAAIGALLGVQQLVGTSYRMDLRVGSVSIAELEEEGATVQAAKYEIVVGMTIALFRGGGLALADTIVKMGKEVRQKSGASAPTPNLEGLSCRWKKIPNRNGCVLTLLAMCNPDAEEKSSVYKAILQQIDNILRPESMKTANPVNIDQAEYKTASEMIKDEIRMHKSCWSVAWIKRLIEILLCHILFYWRLLQYSVIDAPAYVQGMRAHSDHRKFDDMIRMVLDCSRAQADQVEDYLQSLYCDGRQIFYGTQRSDHSIVTCLLEDTSEGNHIHFVDGDAGGYAIAAKQLKMQLGTWSMGRRGDSGSTYRQSNGRKLTC